jgi:recombination protein RecT
MAGPMLSDDQVPALPAASVIVLREAPLEVLMLRRNDRSSFMPGAWVFPGGVAEAIDHELAREQADGSLLSAMRLAGIRETFEETGVWLASPPLEDPEHRRRRLLAGNLTFRHLLSETRAELDTLTWFSRWITPVGIPKRFDTYFFVATVPHGVDASPEDGEAVEVTWVQPARALARHAAGEMHMVLPTLRTLESLREFTSADRIVESRRGASIEPIQPVLVNGKPTLP